MRLFLNIRANQLKMWLVMQINGLSREKYQLTEEHHQQLVREANEVTKAIACFLRLRSQARSDARRIRPGRLHLSLPALTCGGLPDAGRRAGANRRPGSE